MWQNKDSVRKTCFAHLSRECWLFFERMQKYNFKKRPSSGAQLEVNKKGVNVPYGYVEHRCAYRT